MTVRQIMTRDVTTLRTGDPVRKGLELMHRERRRNLAVVDENGRFAGLFGIRQVVHLLLPKMAQIKGGLTNLSFMSDDEDEIQARIAAVWDQPVSDFLESENDLLICEPSTSLPEALELLYQSFHTSLPVLVVDNESRELVGMISGWDVLEKVVMNAVGDDG